MQDRDEWDIDGLAYRSDPLPPTPSLTDVAKGPRHAQAGPVAPPHPHPGRAEALPPEHERPDLSSHLKHPLLLVRQLWRMIPGQRLRADETRRGPGGSWIAAFSRSTNAKRPLIKA